MQNRFSSRKTSFSRLLVAGLTLAISAIALASPMSDAWKLRATNPEAALSQLQQVVRDDPNNSKAFYYMAILNGELGRGAEGLEALNNAKRVDPAGSFTNNADNIPRLERELRKTMGGTTSNRPNRSASTSGPMFPEEQQQEILGAMSSNGVYVAPGMASVADANALASAVRNHPHGAKVIVLDALPGGTNIGSFAQKLHGALNMQDGLLVVATGRPRQAAAYGGSLVSGKSELGELVRTNSATFTSQGYTAGIQAILAAHKTAEADANRTANTGLLFLIGVPAAGGVWYFRRKKAKDATRELKLREETRQLSNELAPQYEKLDSDFEYAVLGETDADKQRDLRETRARAGAAFSGAMKSLNSAQSFNDMVSARASLVKAKDELVRARAILEGKPLPIANAVGAFGAMNGPANQAYSGFGGGAGSMLPPDMQRDRAIASNNFEIPPLGGGYAGARDGQALDFFTSQPVPINDMVPVDIEINGEQRRVWASRESAQAAINGNLQVATVNQGGQQVPWYNAANQYNPWQDFGSTMLQMMAMNMMMNAMFQPSYGFGGGVHHHHYGDSGNSGGYDTSNNSNDNSGAGVGDLDIFGNSGNDNSDSGVADLDLFGGGGGWADSGSDFGGDFGGGDFGGFDGE